eukprot:m51a1_g4222 hypothetical protein (732) ;mRNA; f:94933-97929
MRNAFTLINTSTTVVVMPDGGPVSVALSESGTVPNASTYWRASIDCTAKFTGLLQFTFFVWDASSSTVYDPIDFQIQWSCAVPGCDSQCESLGHGTCEYLLGECECSDGTVDDVEYDYRFLSTWTHSYDADFEHGVARLVVNRTFETYLAPGDYTLTIFRDDYSNPVGSQALTILDWPNWSCVNDADCSNEGTCSDDECVCSGSRFGGHCERGCSNTATLSGRSGVVQSDASESSHKAAMNVTSAQCTWAIAPSGSRGSDWDYIRLEFDWADIGEGDSLGPGELADARTTTPRHRMATTRGGGWHGGAALAVGACWLACRALANVALSDSWKPLAHGVCTKPFLSNGADLSYPYSHAAHHSTPTATLHGPLCRNRNEPTVARACSGANADPLIGEGVGSGSQGVTCGFLESNISSLPPAWRNHFLLAASQDVYAGQHLRVCESCSNKNQYWEDDCSVNKPTRAQAEAGWGCSKSCGECYVINGPQGSSLWIVNEIADANAVEKDGGKGLNFHLDMRHNNEVRNNGGLHKDIQWKRVPCPTDGAIRIRVAYKHPTYDNAIFFTVLNHALGIRAVLNRGGAGGDQEWVPLVRGWTNSWHWEAYAEYGCPSCPQWQAHYGNVYRGSTAKDFQLKVVAIDGQEVVCAGLTAQKEGFVFTCRDASGTPQQFATKSFRMPTDPCVDCTGKRLANCDIPYTKSDAQSGSTVDGNGAAGTAGWPVALAAAAAAVEVLAA